MKNLKKLITTVVLSISCIASNAQWWSTLGADIDGNSNGQRLGKKVSMSADGLNVAIAAEGPPIMGTASNGPGVVKVYKLISGVWTQQGADIVGDTINDFFGDAISLNADGSIVAIGNPLGTGFVRVYKFISGVWIKQGADIIGEAAYDRSGNSISISADGLIVAIGAKGNSNAAGHVRVYKFISGAWTQQGSDIDGMLDSDQLGQSVSLSADGLKVAIGARVNYGLSYTQVYKFISGTWIQQGLTIYGELVSDWSGHSVDISDDGLTVAIGAPLNSGFEPAAGHVRVYKFISGNWTKLGSDIDGEEGGSNYSAGEIGDMSGVSVSLSADGLIVAIGAEGNDDGGDQAGHVRVYKFISGQWIKRGQDIDGEAEGDASGYSASLSADGLTVAIGASRNMDGGLLAGHVRVYKFNSPSSIDEEAKALNNVVLYPNPSNSDVTLNLSKGLSNCQVSIINLIGQEFFVMNNISDEQINLPTKDLKNGIYFVKIQSPNNQQVLKFTKE